MFICNFDMLFVIFNFLTFLVPVIPQILIENQYDESNLLTTIQYEIKENTKVNTQIASIRTDARLAGYYDKDDYKLLQFKLLTDQYNHLFNIDNVSGDVTILSNVDRETLCRSLDNSNCKIELSIAIHPRQYFRIINMVIKIIDENDNTPTFDNKYYTIRMHESVSVGTEFNLPRAHDADFGSLGVVRYSLSPQEHEFDIKFNKTLDGLLAARLVIRQRLDREKRDLYNLKLVAYDGGVPALYDTLKIKIEIMDANDNNPIFMEKTYKAIISEASPPNSHILSIHATDLDLGDNGQVKYKFDSATKSMYGHLFNLDTKNGELTTKERLDYEVQDKYHLVAKAYDLGIGSFPAEIAISKTPNNSYVQSLPTHGRGEPEYAPHQGLPQNRGRTTFILVQLQDVNDNKPIIVISTLTDTNSNTVYIAENHEKNTFVAHVHVKDIDSASQSTVQCELNHAQFYLQQTTYMDYQIKTLEKLNREANDSYSVLDRNDNVPYFDKLLYESEIEENEVPYSRVLVQVKAMDNDIGPNGVVRYFIDKYKSGKFSNNFDINNITGEIYAKIEFDREKSEYMDIVIYAKDVNKNGTENEMKYLNVLEKSLTGSTIVRIHILDKNDNAPKFNYETYSFSVYENEPIGTQVGMLNCIDTDSKEYSEFNYEMSKNYESWNNFKIEKDGKLLTTKILDRENRSVYFLVVKAIDSHNSSLFSSTSISIYVQDVNDNIPILHFPKYPNNTVIVPSNMPINHHIVDIMATDEDIGANAKILYEMHYMDYDSKNFNVNFEKPKNLKKILNGSNFKDQVKSLENVYNLFTINYYTGSIRVNKNLSKYINSEILNISYKIITKDQGIKSLSSQEILYIIINDTMKYVEYAENEIDKFSNSTIKIFSATSTNIFIIGLITFCTLVIMIIIIISVTCLIQKNKKKKYLDESTKSNKVSLNIPKIRSFKPNFDLIKDDKFMDSIQSFDNSQNLKLNTLQVDDYNFYSQRLNSNYKQSFKDSSGKGLNSNHFYDNVDKHKVESCQFLNVNLETNGYNYTIPNVTPNYILTMKNMNMNNINYAHENKSVGGESVADSGHGASDITGETKTVSVLPKGNLPEKKSNVNLMNNSNLHYKKKKNSNFSFQTDDEVSITSGTYILNSNPSNSNSNNGQFYNKNTTKKSNLNLTDYIV
ncbi:Protocadherin-11 [Intoshia linei]|uniref:Protocadherin-11 n=1 Tax=Intoshia linei TaxID=1819745 RepID=A0A177AZW2_9BILA|nr:Protocadherin-11 [Intoshia linei]